MSDTNVRWCVSSDLEFKKCHTLQKAADAMKIIPRFTCNTMRNRSQGLESVKSGKCDIFVITPSERLQARESVLILNYLTYKSE